MAPSPACPVELTAASLPTNFGSQGLGLVDAGTSILYCTGSDVKRYSLPGLTELDGNEWSTTLAETGEEFLGFTPNFNVDNDGNIYTWDYLNPSTDSLLSLVKLTYTGDGSPMGGEVLFTYDDPDVAQVTSGWNPYDGYLYHVIGSSGGSDPDGFLRRTDTTTGSTSTLYGSRLVSVPQDIAFTPDGAVWLHNDESGAVGVYRYLSSLEKFVDNTIDSAVPIPFGDDSVMMPDSGGGYVVFSSTGSTSAFDPPCSPSNVDFRTVSQLPGGCVVLMQGFGESVWGF